MENKPICYVPGREIPEIYSGVPTFLGLPKISVKEQISKHDIVVLGVPWEGVCTYGSFSTCELAPKTIRQASVRYGGFLPDYDLDIFDHFSGGDYGDCAVQNGNEHFTFQSMREKFQDIVAIDKMPLVFGGDHSISYPLISEMAKKHPHKLGILHFDAHLDNVLSFGEEKYARCSPFHRLYEDQNIDPAKLVHFGIRGPRNHPAGLKAAKNYGASVMTAWEIKTLGIQQAIKKALQVACKDAEALYVTVCSDVLDVANNPGGPPDPCGLTSFEMALALHECGKAKAAAFDFVEIYPGQDANNVSSHVAVWLTLHLLAGKVLSK